MEQNRLKKYTHTHRKTNFQLSCKDSSVGKGQSFQQVVLEKLDVNIQKNQLQYIPHILYKN